MVGHIPFMYNVGTVRGGPCQITNGGAIRTMNIEGLATKITTAYIKSSVNLVTKESQLLEIIADVTSALKSLQSK
jgi:hypothetical protein